jgi:hypothetical protein
LERSIVAQVCSRSWNRIGRSFADFRSGLSERLRRFEGLMRVPTSVEDEAARLVQGAHPLHLFELAGEVAAEGFYGGRRQPDNPPAVTGLRLPGRVDLPHLRERAPHPERPGFEVHVVPLEGKDLALAHPGTGDKTLCGECERLNGAGGPVGNLTGL